MKVRKLELGEKYVQEKGMVAMHNTTFDFEFFIELDDGTNYIKFCNNKMSLHTFLFDEMEVEYGDFVYKVEK